MCYERTLLHNRVMHAVNSRWTLFKSAADRSDAVTLGVNQTPWKVKLLQSEEVRISLESNRIWIESHAPFLDVSGENQLYAQKHYPMNMTQTKPTSICWPTHFRPLKWCLWPRKRLKSPDLEHQPALKPLNSLPWSSKKSNYRFFFSLWNAC